MALFCFSSQNAVLNVGGCGFLTEEQQKMIKKKV